MQDNTLPESIQANIPYAVSAGEPLVVVEPREGEGDATRNFTDEIREMTITNARSLDMETLFESEGFTLLNDKLVFEDFGNSGKIVEHYYPACEQVAKTVMGASRVIAFDHNIRVDGDSEEHRKPAGITHIDLTETSARRILQEQLTESQFKKVANKRFAFVNTWRPLRNPVYSSHLAFCSASSAPESSLLRAELQYEDRVGELYYCQYHEDHKWFYFPHMNADEIILLKNFDSGGNAQTSRTPHTAIDDSTAPEDAPRRESIEVRLIVLFDE